MRLKDTIRSLIFRLKVAQCGQRVTIGKSISLFNPQYIIIGNDVILNHHISFFVNPLNDKAQLIIGNRVQLGKYNDFGCSNKIVIEDDVITAPFVHITDRDHTYEDITIPIMSQTANSKGPVVVRKGSWIGFGAQIMSGVTIGLHSVVAAGSIVTKDVPNYSVVAGNPAKVIKRYNFETQQWEKI